MDKFEVLSEALKIIDPKNTVTPGSLARNVIMKVIFSKVDKLGPEETLKEINRTKAHLIGQVGQMTTMEKGEGL